jgi:hypothetical protein
LNSREELTLDTQLVTHIPVARIRRSTRALAVRALGPITIVGGLLWAVLHPWRVTLLHPRGEPFWWLFVQPPLWVVAVGIGFALLIAPGVVADLEEAEADAADRA